MRTSASGWVKTLWLLAEDQKQNPAGLFAISGLDPSQLDNPYYRYAQDSITQFWTRLVERTGHQDIGLQFGRLVNVSTFNAIGYLMLSSPTMAEALRYGIQYQKYLSEATQAELTLQGDHYELLITNVGDQVKACVQSVEAALSAFIYFARWITQSHFSPVMLRLEHAPTADIRVYEALFGCPVELGAAKTGLVLEAAMLNNRLFTHDPHTHKQHLHLAETQFRSVTSPMTHQLHQLFDTLVPLGQASIDTLAEMMHCSSKTLQRKLKHEQTSFKAELEPIVSN
jgi:hypothetical protein